MLPPGAPPLPRHITTNRKRRVVASKKTKPGSSCLSESTASLRPPPRGRAPPRCERANERARVDEPSLPPPPPSEKNEGERGVEFFASFNSRDPNTDAFIFLFFLNVKLFAPPQCRSRVDHPLVRRGREVARRVARMHFNR